MQLGQRQSEVIEVLIEHGGGLVMMHLCQAIRGIKRHDLLKAVDRLCALGIVAVTRRRGRGLSRDGDLVELRMRVIDAPDASLAGNGTARATQPRPEAP